MKSNRTRLSQCISIALMAQIGWSMPVLAADDTQYGVDGTPGLDGVSGSPGSAGTVGGAGADATATATGGIPGNYNYATAYGGDGGAGGNGGAGVTEDASGGNGGAGGAGGDAVASSTVNQATSATAYAGNGGAGGSGGLATGIGVNGIGGAGGDGGSATVVSAGISALGYAHGGAGGASVIGGGVGGSANATTTAVNSSDDAWASGGAVGGWGGDVVNGNGDGGAGGHAVSQSAATDGVNYSGSDTMVHVNDAAYGGHGGNTYSTTGTALADGDGGAGGSANSNAMGLSAGDSWVWVTSEAVGGAGGSAAGAGNRGGNGGAATATAHGEALSTNRLDTGSWARGFVEVAAIQQGGSGGYGTYGADGGDGADSTLINAATGWSRYHKRSLTQRAVGGGGGHSDGGVAGAAGDAYSELTVAGEPPRAVNGMRESISGLSSAVGGAGGFGSRNGEDTSSSGGAATASISLTGEGRISAMAEAIGGEGMGGATGGAATLGFVRGVSTDVGDVDVSGYAKGGDSSGQAASVHLANAVSGVATSGNVSLSQTAVGGNATASTPGPITGSAGSAYSYLDDSNSNGQALNMHASATGGNGIFASLDTAIASAGADGTAIVLGSARSVNLSTAAWGGDGGSAHRGLTAGGGVATADAQGEGQWVNVSGSAVGGRAGDADGIEVRGGVGGDASSSSYGVFQNYIGSQYGHVVVTDSAVGGQGGSLSEYLTASGTHVTGGTGGDATSYANGLGGPTTDVTSSAQGGAGGHASDGYRSGRGGNASANAVAQNYGTASVNARASANGGAAGGMDNIGGSAHARATGISAYGNGTATAVANSSGRLFTSVQASATASVQGNSGTADAYAAVAQPAPASLIASDVQAAAYITGLPDAEVANAALAGNTQVMAGVYAGGSARFVGLMMLGAGGYHVGQNQYGQQTFTSSVSFSLDTTQLAPKNLLLGFLDPTSSGNGFDQLYFQIFQEGVSVFDQTFNDLAEANSYFDDHLFDLGDWNQGLEGDLDLAFNFTVTASNAGDWYGVNMVVAQAVPVPAAAWLFGSGLCGILALARRKTFA